MIVMSGSARNPRFREDAVTELGAETVPAALLKIPTILTKPSSLDKIMTGADQPSKASLLSPHDSAANLVGMPIFVKTRDDLSAAMAAPRAPGVASGGMLGHGIPALLQAGETFLGSSSGLQPPMQPVVYQIQQRTSVGGEQTIHLPGSSAAWTEPPTMTQPVRLIDESMHWCESAAEHLTDQSDYLVVGFIGSQCVGKSYLASILAGNKYDDPEKSFIFKLQTKETLETSSHQTSGIQLFATRERILILDSQPLLSPSLLNYFIQNERKYSTDYAYVENYLESQCLQQLMLLMTICHVIVIVDDWFTDPNLLRFIQTAEMLKPQVSHSSLDAEESQEYYPNIVFVQNRCTRRDYSVENYLAMQNVLQIAFDRSKLQYKGRVNMAVDLFPDLGDLNPDVNLYLVPELKPSSGDSDDSSGFQFVGYPDVGVAAQRLRNHILAMPRPQLTHATLTEKNWLQYAARSWESIKKSQYLSEYNRLLP